MFRDARKLKAGDRLEYEVCIIGGGVAGILLALEHIETEARVVLLPGGGPNQTTLGLDLYRGKVSPPKSHEPLEENRLRMWGGTTTVWGGRCIPFDPIDFAQREWISFSGWPLPYTEVTSYLDRATELCEAGAGDFDARSVFPGKPSEIIQGFDDNELVSWPLERWSVPTDFSRRYRKELEGAANITVLMHAHATHLQMSTDGRRLDHLKAACQPGKSFDIVANNFVLAAGALENARLMLAARDVHREGIGNKHDLVGRFYQSHRFGVCGTVELNKPRENFIYDFERDWDGVYCRRRFWLTPEAQEKYRIGNVIGFFFRNVTDGSEHRNAMVSTVLLAKTLLGGARRGPRRLWRILKEQRAELFDHLKVIVKDGPGLFGQLAAVAYTRFFQQRRLPMVLPSRKANRFGLFFQSEHAPLPESRVTLDESNVDDFGMPRLDVSVRFSDIDYRTITTFVRLFKERLESQGLGKLHLSEKDKEFLDHPEKQKFNSNAHHIGTTRMSSDPETGVVDTNCKVHGVDNLYVAGSSVFPTSGHANPVLMIAMLALRLADHLKAKGRGN